MSPALRLGASLAALTVSLILAVEFLFGIFPDQRTPILEARKRFCESIAVQFSALAERYEHDSMRRTMVSLVTRSPDVLSIGLRVSGGELLASAGDHTRTWEDAPPTGSTMTHARVPIFNGPEPWGTMEVRFKDLHGSWYEELLANPLVQLLLFMGLAGVAFYSLFMRRALRYLDPSAVVPGRVKAALDQLVEGVVLLDNRLRIVLVNDAFSAKLDRDAAGLLGLDISKLGWVDREGEKQDERDLPWESITRTGGALTDQRLCLTTPKLGLRVLSTNVSPIVDGSGKQRGMMVSFDDISEVERVNEELSSTIVQLEEAEKAVRKKNEELHRLASIDPLTGSLNRRAFYEKLDAEFAVARRDGLPLSCIMADIDHFKKVNDTYGHAVGDEVIKAMAGILEANCVANGAVGRYGGEEFCVLLPGVDVEQATQIAEKVRRSFSEWSSFPVSPTNGNPITASSGVSAAAFDARDGAAMVDQADQALYHSKTHGRNQVTRWPDIADSVQSKEQAA